MSTAPVASFGVAWLAGEPSSGLAALYPEPAGAAWDDHSLVFCTAVGAPLDGVNVLRSAFWPLLQQGGLPRIRFHDLRHTCATLLLGRGVNPKIVSELLGHSTVAITLDLYSHVLPTMQQQAATALEAALSDTKYV